MRMCSIGTVGSEIVVEVVTETDHDGLCKVRLRFKQVVVVACNC